MNVEVITYYFLGLLSMWSLGWLIYSLLKLNRTSRGDRYYYWLTHAVWSVVNLCIAGLSLRATTNTELFSDEYLRSQRAIVGVNILLDFVYLFVAYRLSKSSKTAYTQSAKAITVQASFLLVFDIVLVAFYSVALQ